MGKVPLVLGTAQLGLSYGIANKTGQPNLGQAEAIVQEAWSHGIREFDTAQGYGTCETVLGNILKKLRISHEAKVISKFDPALNHQDKDQLSDALEQTLSQFAVPQLYGMMLHREVLLNLWDHGLGETLLNFVHSGKVQMIGVSVSSPTDALRALKIDGIDLVQIPSNILDHRFETVGVFQLAQKLKKKIYIRSVFLQGLILMHPHEIPVSMEFARPFLEKLQKICHEMQLTPHEVALGYLKLTKPKTSLVFGAETVAQVTQNIQCWQKEIPPVLIPRIQEAFKQVPESLVNPSMWPE